MSDWRARLKKYDPRRRLDTPPRSGDQILQFGFRWGPFEVQRTAAVRRGKGGETRVLSLVTDAGHLLEVYVSPTGRSVRAFLDHAELKVPSADSRVKCAPEDWLCAKCGSPHTLLKGMWVHICEDQVAEGVLGG